MNSAPASCRQPLPWDVLVRYWLGELDDDATQQVDRHLLGCDACGARLDEIIALADGVRGALKAGLVTGIVADTFAQRLAERGLRVRRHHVERDGSVNCTIAPDDDVVVAHLAAPLAGIERLDLVLQLHGEPESRLPDIPFDAARGEVVVVEPAARLRALPACVEQARLVAVDASGAERVVGRYTFNHRPYADDAP